MITAVHWQEVRTQLVRPPMLAGRMTISHRCQRSALPCVVAFKRLQAMISFVVQGQGIISGAFEPYMVVYVRFERSRVRNIYYLYLP